MAPPIHVDCRKIRQSGDSIVMSVPKKALRELGISPEEIEEQSKTVRVLVDESGDMSVSLSDAAAD